MPKEKEWEIACNNGRELNNGKPCWYFGNDENKLKEYAWYRGNATAKTHLVGDLKSNELKLYDMHGNVWEWCNDRSYEDKESQVLRGGSWGDYATDTHCNALDWYFPQFKSYFVGFRLLRALSS